MRTTRATASAAPSVAAPAAGGLPAFDERALLRFVEERGGALPEGLRVRDARGGAAAGVNSSGRYYLALEAGDDGGEGPLRVPRECWMEPERGWRRAELLERFRASCEDPGAADCVSRPWVVLALRLLDELQQGPSSAFAAYLPTLEFGGAGAAPAPYLRALAAVGDAAGAEGLQLAQTCLQYREFVGAVWDRLADAGTGLVGLHADAFPAGQYNLENFLWAFSVLRARTFHPLVGDDIALVPLLDLAAHEPDSARWQRRRGVFGKEGVELAGGYARRAGPGRAVCMRFDDPSANLTTSQLLLDYGVVEEAVWQAGRRVGFQLTLSLDEDDPNYDDKLDVLEAEGLGGSATFHLSGGAPPDAMLPFLRLVNLAGADAFLLEAVFRQKVWGFMKLPVSRENEECVCTSMIDGSKEALACMPRAEGAPGAGDILSVAAMAEQGAVLATLDFFESQLAVLGELEYYQERRLKELNLIDRDGQSTYDPWDDMTIA